ncbi:radical SAM protein [Caldisericum exile]|uniref:Radical SAM core domain-containing protein n=1 Tax=Caldisericum exile (strain DSM 21853 / NBRC 104410 / AZM16c01) TaxID=511051 RepID=A0A7U6GD82_CALEA|nr:radical SAM protein [Caldisericum exile]BAL80234.1 hypothetical protein CSE_01080 [Caldisericum exile AZM16c01]
MRIKKRELPNYVHLFQDGDNVIIFDLLRQGVFETNIRQVNNFGLLKKYGVIPDELNSYEDNFLKLWARSICYNTNIFSSYILLTYNCNMKCLYCYERNINVKRNDSDTKTVNKILKWIKNEVKFNNSSLIDIAFFGGEPLLRNDLLVYLASDLKLFSNLNNIKFNFTLITNGTLLSPIILLELIKAEVKTIQITLDGWKTMQDYLRPLKGGRNSYELILKNISENREIIKKNNMKIIINVNLNWLNSNVEIIAPLLDDLVKIDLGNNLILSFSEVFCPIGEPSKSVLYEHTMHC